MNAMKLLSLLILTLLTSRIEGIYECCPDDNVLSLITKTCINNDNISLECSGYRFPYNTTQLKEINYLFMNDTLIDQSTNLEIKYCQSHLHNDSVDKFYEMYIICYELTETFEDNTIKVGAILGYISVVFTILTIIVYVMVPKLLDLQGICMIHALIGLTAGYTFLGLIQLLPYFEDTTCQFMAFLTYFSFIYLFFWLNALSFHIWRTTVYPEFLSSKQWSIIYHIFAIGGTMVFLTFLLVAHYSTSQFWEFIRPGLGVYSCWFQSMRETMIFFYGPIACLLLLNVIFYLWTIVVLWGKSENTSKKIFKYRLKLCVKLFIIMGVTWVFEIITAVLKDPNMTFFGKLMFFLLDLFNILQGLLIFLTLVVFRKKVRRALAHKNLCNIQFPNSWRYLEDEEIESVEERINGTVAEYKDNKVGLDNNKTEVRKN